MNDRAAFRTAATISVLLCLIWDFATVVLFIVLPLQLAAIGLLYWGAVGLFGPGTAGSGPRPGRAGRVSVQASRALPTGGLPTHGLPPGGPPPDGVPTDPRHR